MTFGKVECKLVHPKHNKVGPVLSNCFQEMIMNETSNQSINLDVIYQTREVEFHQDIQHREES